jgi:hypothetical protein
MSVAFEIEVAPSRAHARTVAAIRAVPAVGAALVALQVAGGPTVLAGDEPLARALAVALGASLAVVLSVAALLAWRRPAAPGAPLGTVLAVDAAGEATLRAPGAAAPRPVSLKASCRLPGLTVLILAPYLLHSPEGRGARMTTLLLGRDAMPDDAWRRLHAWLRWLERGRRLAPAPGSDPT